MRWYSRSELLLGEAFASLARLGRDAAPLLAAVRAAAGVHWHAQAIAAAERAVAPPQELLRRSPLPV